MVEEDVKTIEGERNDLAVYDIGFKEGIDKGIDDTTKEFFEKIEILKQRLPRFSHIIDRVFKKEEDIK